MDNFRRYLTQDVVSEFGVEYTGGSYIVTGIYLPIVSEGNSYEINLTLCDADGNTNLGGRKRYSNIEPSYSSTTYRYAFANGLKIISGGGNYRNGYTGVPFLVYAKAYQDTSTSSNINYIEGVAYRFGTGNGSYYNFPKSMVGTYLYLDLTWFSASGFPYYKTVSITNDSGYPVYLELKQ